MHCENKIYASLYSGTPPYGHPLNTDTRIFSCGQFRLSRRGKAHAFSLKLTRLIRTRLIRTPRGHAKVSLLTGVCILKGERGLILEKVYDLFRVGTNETVRNIRVSVLGGVRKAKFHCTDTLACMFP